MKRKTRNIILLSIGIIISLVIYGRHNFESDKQQLLALKTKVANGHITYAIDTMNKMDGYSNPLINMSYKRWKKEMFARFVTKDEVIENTSGNKIVFEISNIYREYWREQLLIENKEERTDTTLYIKLTNYLISNNLTTISRDSLSKTIKNDSEMKRIIESQGFKTKFMYRNGFQEIIIWDDETVNQYEVMLPKDTINAKVIFIENYHLNGYDNYASIGSSKVGGWAIKESATLYCNKGEYNLTSEKFKTSYLKHESIHFTDLNDYPNLSSADLEYRAKIIELMYCTKSTIHDIINDFIHAADSSQRTHSHPYANYSLIKNLSKQVFNSEFESTASKWKKVDAEKINEAALKLYETSEMILQKDTTVSKII
ncbi:hypothetical protein N9P38_01965 [Flavobacteriales bacterium]|nr:hypothetical protein [Flavobacteriales bacterium]MDB4088508.1 hypothetical protein [Flavobacteriales bacterium]